MTREDLHARILAAHDSNDHLALVDLYADAAKHSQDVDEACFFLTYAYVFALELDHPKLDELAKQLKSHNRL